MRARSGLCGTKRLRQQTALEPHTTAVDCVIACALRIRLSGASAPNLLFRTSSPKPRVSKSRTPWRVNERRLRSCQLLAFLAKAVRRRRGTRIIARVGFAPNISVPARSRQIMSSLKAAFVPAPAFWPGPLHQCHQTVGQDVALRQCG